MNYLDLSKEELIKILNLKDRALKIKNCVPRKYTRALEDIEDRFLEITGLTCNLDKFPLEEKDCQQMETNKEKSNKFGEVFTPFYFVDKMILKATDSLKRSKTTHDLCAGYGQFTIRMLRFLINNKKKFNPRLWLKNTHSFSEYQISSAYKLLYIFGTDINLFIGDACHLSKLKDTDMGILFYDDDKKKWVNVTKKIKKLFKNKSEKNFVDDFNKIKNNVEKKSQQTLF